MKSFGERVYYGDPSQGHRDAWLTDDPRLREHLPSDTEKRVERAYKQWNKVLRNRLGSETRLRLTIDDDQIAIPVKIVDGLPAPFAHVIREFDGASDAVQCDSDWHHRTIACGRTFTPVIPRIGW